MAKQNGGQQVGDWRQMRQFVTPMVAKPNVIKDALYAEGQHNVVIDRRKEGELAIYIATDEEALAAMLKTTKSDGEAGAEYLARTMGPRFPSVSLDIGGEIFFLKVELQKYVPKAKAKK